MSENKVWRVLHTTHGVVITPSEGFGLVAVILARGYQIEYKMRKVQAFPLFFFEIECDE